MERSIVKNTAWLFSGQAIGRAIRAVVIIYAARLLGASSWGVFSYALSLAATFTVLSDVGVNALLVREGSKDPSSRKKYLSTGLVVKLVVLGILGLISLSLQDVIIRIPEVSALMPLIILIFFFDSLRDFVSALSRSLDRMDIEAKGQIMTNIGIVIFCFLALVFSATAWSMTLGYVAGTLIGLAYVAMSLRDEFKGIFKHFRKSLVKTVLFSAWPFGLVSLMGVIMVNTDVLVLGQFGSSVDVGLFSAAQKPVQMLFLIPALLAAAFFPNMAEATEDKKKFGLLFSKGMKAIYLFALPIALGGAALAEPIIRAVYGNQYIYAYPSFLVLCLTCLFVFPSIFMTNAIFAKGGKKVFLPYALIGIFGNIILDIILIPLIGITGCAVATLIVQGALFLYGLYALNGIINRPLAGLWRIILGALFTVAIAMAFYILGANVLIAIAASAIIYPASLIVLREPSVREIMRILKRSPSVTSGVEV
ncbi:MAG: flippase [Candidatus Colwellbacteria bacterium]|nr:flippase [Candidatus Colwellbacteria bacterium]